MKIKRILRFYFYADSLNKALDNIIIKQACASAGSGNAIESAEGLCRLIGEKQTLSVFWDYLDAIIKNLPQGAQATLKEYASLREGLKKLDAERVKRIRRVIAVFRRRARRLEHFSDAILLAGRYYCLSGP